jgi:two-component system sensor histidine kinase AlgZ
VHPFFNRLDHLVSYLGLSLAIGAAVAVSLAAPDSGWLASSAFVLPLAFLYASVCLSAWYVCRAVPLTASAIPRSLVASGIAALLASSLLIVAARVWIVTLDLTPGFLQAGLRFRSLLPLMFAAGVLLYVLSLAVHYTFLAFETAREAEHRRLQLEVLAREAELRALRAQIDPHFLYNSLNSISALTGRDPAGARRMCLLLAEFLRNTLDLSGLHRIPLADELALVDRFLDIEQVRFGSRLQVARSVDEGALHCLVPPLILQPLIENAVAHGIARLLDGGVIALSIEERGARLSITIENACDPDPPVAGASTGVGLENVRRRLEATFGRAARLETRSDPSRFRVEIDLPSIRQD